MAGLVSPPPWPRALLSPSPKSPSLLLLPRSPPPPARSPPGHASARPLLVSRSITAEDTRRAELLCRELVRPIAIVKYGVDVRVSCEGGSFHWTERDDADVVRSAIGTVMAIPLRTHMARDRINSASKDGFLRAMVLGAPGTGSRLQSWADGFPCFMSWLVGCLAELRTCYRSQHEKGAPVCGVSYASHAAGAGNG